MSLSDHLNILRFIILPIVLCTALVSLPLALCHRKMQKKSPTGTWLFVFVFGLLGGIVGICTGASRQPVVATVLPAILTLMTAIFGYAFTREGLAEMRSVIPFSLAAMLLAAVYCAFLGAKIRFDNEVFATDSQKKLLRFERVDLEVEKAVGLKQAGIPVPTVEVQRRDTSLEAPNADFVVPKK